MGDVETLTPQADDEGLGAAIRVMVEAGWAFDLRQFPDKDGSAFRFSASVCQRVDAEPVLGFNRREFDEGPMLIGEPHYAATIEEAVASCFAAAAMQPLPDVKALTA